MTEHRFTVSEGNRERLDSFLALRLPELSRSRIGALIRAGAARVGGRAEARPAHRPAPGAEICLRVPPPADLTPAGQAIPLAIAYEDDAVIVIDKPAGLVVHPAPGNPDRTLVNALIAHCGESLSGIGDARRPGIVHRLDKDTSGLIVAAKTDAAHRGLARQFAAHTIDRAYRAAVHGVPAPASGLIEGAIGRHPRHRKKMAVVARGKPARTRYALEAAANAPQGGRAALVRCTLETGRTHQIRVHLAHRGWPVVGDGLYGIRNDCFSRQALHACLIGFTHPLSRRRMRFRSELPKDVKILLQTMGIVEKMP